VLGSVVAVVAVMLELDLIAARWRVVEVVELVD
jgi:hypothetical protein